MLTLKGQCCLSDDPELVSIAAAWNPGLTEDPHGKVRLGAPLTLFPFCRIYLKFQGLHLWLCAVCGCPAVVWVWPLPAEAEQWLCSHLFQCFESCHYFPEDFKLVGVDVINFRTSLMSPQLNFLCCFAEGWLPVCQSQSWQLFMGAVHTLMLIQFYIYQQAHRDY